MASALHRADEEASPPLLIPSLAPSTEQLPDIMSLSVAEPVLATNKRLRLSNFIVPAVRIRLGLRVTAVYPLDRESIGDSWVSEQQIAEWEYRELPKGWAEAVATFRLHVDYPIEFLTLFLTTLRVGNFLNNQPITPALWRDACRAPVDTLVIQSICSKCATLRSFAARTLLTAPSTFPRWHCAHFGMDCQHEEVHPIFVVAPDQWLLGLKESPAPTHSVTADAAPSFPVECVGCA